MIELDDTERWALHELLHLMEEESFSPNPRVDENQVHRTPEGQIVVPIQLEGDHPSAHLGMLMTHKAEQISKQTACRFLLTQRPLKDPEGRIYVWTEHGWHVLS